MVKLTKDWEDCKTKEDKEKFKKEMNKIINSGKTISHDKVIFEAFMRS